MNRRLQSGSDDSAARAFQRVGWARLLATLQRYATTMLGLAPLDAVRAGEVESADVANTVLAKSLDGTLPWSLSDDATDEEIIGLACTKAKGMHWTLRRRAARAVPDEALDERADEGPDAFALLEHRREIEDVEQAVSHDAEASAHLREMLAGQERAQIAEALGCTVQHVDVVRNRIIRATIAACAATNDEGEDGPPSSGPRGSYHETPTTQERQGAPGEPHRGALRAGRRR